MAAIYVEFYNIFTVFPYHKTIYVIWLSLEAKYTVVLTWYDTVPA